MTKAEYTDYLSRPHWRTVRRQYLEKYGRACHGVECSAVATDVHHWTYARLGNEKLEDLVGVCRECHERIHKITGPQANAKALKKATIDVCGAVSFSERRPGSGAKTPDRARRQPLAGAKHMPRLPHEVESPQRSRTRRPKGMPRHEWETLLARSRGLPTKADYDEQTASQELQRELWWFIRHNFVDETSRTAALRNLWTYAVRCRKTEALETFLVRVGKARLYEFKRLRATALRRRRRR